MPQQSLVSSGGRPQGQSTSRALRRVMACLPVVMVLAACGKQEQAPEPDRYVRTQVLSPQSTGMQREYAAEVRARVESQLSFRVAGKLLERKVDLGAVIKRGEVLARLDPQDLLLAQEAAKASMFAARVNRDQLAADYKRYIDLHNQGFISAAELDRRDAAFKAAQAQLDQARAQSDVQGNQSRYANLVADVSGVVTGVLAEPGMVVAAGTPVVKVAVDGPRDIVFSVPEDQIPVVRAAAAKPGGMSVRLWSDTKSAPLPIELRELAASADPTTRTFLVKAELKNADVHLGQTATVILSGTQSDQSIKLPLSAVAEIQGRSSVLLLDGKTMTVQPRAVEIAGAEGNELIVKGLTPGMEVVTAGAHVLTPGQKVKRYRPPGPPAESGTPAQDAPPLAAPSSAASAQR